MTDAEAKAIMLDHLRLTKLAGPIGKNDADALEIAITKFDRCVLLENWIRQLCATIKQNDCDVDGIVELALKAIES